MPLKFRYWKKQESNSRAISVECDCAGTVGFSVARWDVLVQYVAFRKGLLLREEWCVWL
jgi:hypothetical protein